jgi:non-specific serine/threonine protein kinase
MPQLSNKLTQFWQEVKRRKILPFIIAYVAACFAIIEFVLNASETFSVPDKTIRLLYLLSVIGIPVVILIPWYINRRRQERIPDESSLKSESSAIQDKSIIVLPFENISPDPDQEYFSDGLTEEIITDLSHIHDLLVISRSSAMTFKGTKKKIREIASDVNVRYVIEGSVRKAGNNLRITAQLIDASNDSHLWAEKYSGVLEDVFEIQEKVSRSIVDSLELKLNPAESQHLADRPIRDLIAYEIYLRAKHKLTCFTEEDIDDAIVLLEKALQIEGPNELLYTTLGVAYTQYYMVLSLKPGESVLVKAESYADKVFELNPDSPEGHALKGSILSYQGKTREAVVHLKKAYEINSKNSTALFYLSMLCGFSGHMETARFYYKKLSAVEPWSGLNPGWFDFYSGNWEKAIDGYYKEYKMAPESPYTRWAYGSVLAYAFHTDEACIILEQIVKDTPDIMFGQFASFLLNALRGNTEEACRVITPEIASSWKGQLQIAYMVASIYSMMGKTDESLDWLEHAINRGFINYPFLNEYDPFLDNIRGEERFKKLMERVKYEWENFEV